MQPGMMLDLNLDRDILYVQRTMAALLFHQCQRSGLPPWEAPVMIAENRKLFFLFLSFTNASCP